MNALHAAALEATRRGLHVFPLRPGTKKPLTAHGHLDATTAPAAIERWWSHCPAAGIGVACRASGVLVIDVDQHEADGAATLTALERQFGALPATWRVLTPGRGVHYYFHAAGDLDRVPGSLGPGVDVKWNGYAVWPPSPHPSGGIYCSEIGFEPDDLPLAPLPAWILTRRGSDRLRFDAAPLALRRGQRNRRLFQLAAAFRRYGIGESALLDCMIAINREHASPPPERDELRQIVSSAGRYCPTPEAFDASGAFVRAPSPSRDFEVAVATALRGRPGTEEGGRR